MSHEVLANIAARFPVTISPYEAITRAYILLEVADFVCKSLKAGKNIDTGIECYFEASQISLLRKINKHVVPQDLIKSDGKYGYLPIPFDTALSRLIGTHTKKIDREPRFRRFLPVFLNQGSFENNGEECSAVNSEIFKWKENGIPLDTLNSIWKKYSDWWTKSERDRKSEDAKERQAKKREAFAKKEASAPQNKKKNSAQGK